MICSVLGTPCSRERWWALTRLNEDGFCTIVMARVVALFPKMVFAKGRPALISSMAAVTKEEERYWEKNRNSN